MTLLIFPDFFLNAITEDMVLTNAIPLFVHYHGIVHRNKHKDIMKNKKKKIGVFYYDYINNLFMLYRFYLEIFCRIVFNNVDKKDLPKLISDFDANKSYSCRQKIICDKKICPTFKKTIFYCYQENYGFILQHC